ncbi:hypothetical protein K438DRAFT_1752084 [Mycena galopus ATCC 62051]|nr:hypothetical protein K438DRAFT_1752084 [Mycena galopus ATCC 62051]
MSKFNQLTIRYTPWHKVSVQSWTPEMKLDAISVSQLKKKKSAPAVNNRSTHRGSWPRKSWRQKFPSYVYRDPPSLTVSSERVDISVGYILDPITQPQVLDPRWDIVNGNCGRRNAWRIAMVSARRTLQPRRRGVWLTSQSVRERHYRLRIRFPGGNEPQTKIFGTNYLASRGTSFRFLFLCLRKFLVLEGIMSCLPVILVPPCSMGILRGACRVASDSEFVAQRKPSNQRSRIFCDPTTISPDPFPSANTSTFVPARHLLSLAGRVPFKFHWVLYELQLHSVAGVDRARFVSSSVDLPGYSS